MSEPETALTVVNAELMSVDEYEQTKKWIARKQEQGLASGDWKPEVLKVIRTMCCPPTSKGEKIPAPQLEVFLHRVRKYRLDPLNGEIYTIPRMGRVKDDYGNWSDGPTVWQPFVGRDGYRAIAERTGLLEYPPETTVYPEPQPDWEKALKPVWARCVVKRRDQSKPVVAIVYFEEYSTGRSTWKDKPRTMIAKVAEATALRQAFNINGVYDQAEFDKTDIVESMNVAPLAGAFPTTLKLIPEDESLPSRAFLLQAEEIHREATRNYKANGYTDEGQRDRASERMRAAIEAFKEDQKALRERLKEAKKALPPPPDPNAAHSNEQRKKLEAMIGERLGLDDSFADRDGLKTHFFVETLGLPFTSSDWTKDQMSKAIQALGDEIEAALEGPEEPARTFTEEPPDVGMTAEELAAQDAAAEKALAASTTTTTATATPTGQDPHLGWPVPSCPVCGLSETKRARGKDAHFFCKAEGCGARFNRPDDAVLDAIVAGVGELGEDALSALAADTKEAGVPEGHRSWNMVQAATMGRLLAFVVKGAAPGSGDVEF